MQLDYLTGIRGNGALTYAGPERLVRLSRFSAVEAEAFCRAVRTLADGGRDRLLLESLSFVEANGYSLVLQTAESDGVLESSDEMVFSLTLTRVSFGKMLRVMEPFCSEGVHGHVWLVEAPAGIALLLSTGGSW